MSRSPKRNLAPVCALAAAATVFSAARGQDLGLTAHMGTLGLGADVFMSVQPGLGLRASLNYFPFDIRFEADSIDYSLELPSPQLLLVADFYPAGQFRLSGGVMIGPTDFEVTGELVEPRVIGNTVYSPAEVGIITGTVDTHDISPYIGIGFGNPAANRISFFFDLGVAFHGNPQASAAADGPIASSPGFRHDLDTEVQDIQDDIENIIVYPVLSLGFSIRLGR